MFAGPRPLHDEFTVEMASPELLEDLKVKQWGVWGTEGSAKYKKGIKSPLKVYDCNTAMKKSFTALVASTIITNVALPAIYPAIGIAVAHAETEAPVAVAPAVPKLSANDLLKDDINPKLDLLKDVLFILKLYPSYAESKDYFSIRQGLREGPTQELRKTCRKLEKYLPADQLDPFKKTYAVMIDNMNYMDVLALQRVQGSGVPDEGKKDEGMVKAIDSTVSSYEAMLKTISI